MTALICDENDRTKSLEHDTRTKCEGRWITTRKIDRAYQAEKTRLAGNTMRNAEQREGCGAK